MIGPRRAALSFAALVACGGAGGGGTTEDPARVDGGASVDARAEDATVDAAATVAARPFAWRAPPGLAAPAPVLVFLHGIGAAGVAQDALYLQLGDEAVARGWVFASPDGTVGADGRRFWNATEACCGGPRTGIDDVAYIDALLTDLATKAPVDRRRVAIFGYSNGGFMAERFACDRASRLAAFVAFEGGGELDRARCRPETSVGALFLHGTADAVARIEGGTFPDNLQRYPALAEVMSTWQSRNGCTGPVADTGLRLDLQSSTIGNETERWVAPGCAKTSPVWHFRAVGGPHIPTLTPGWRTPIFAFLESVFAARIE